MNVVSEQDLARWRAISALNVLLAVADHVKIDRSFKPKTRGTTTRVHVAVAGSDWELLVDGPKFYDTRAHHGGGGAVDLVMHLQRVRFKDAVALLRARRL